MRAAVVLLSAVLLAACAPKPGAEPAAQSSAPPVPAAPEPDAAATWLGKWTGPEGTYLEIASLGGAYTVTVSNLDGPRSFAAKPGAGSLDFERDGVTESIRATDGPGTGMKWLATKTTCLVVRTGEGFCRD